METWNEDSAAAFDCKRMTMARQSHRAEKECITIRSTSNPSMAEKGDQNEEMVAEVVLHP